MEARAMTADVELLPLPPARLVIKHDRGPTSETEPFWNRRDVSDYARTYAAHVTAARDAEIDALRAEVAEWKAIATWDKEQHDRLFKEARALNERAERLAEALRDAFKAMQRSYHSDVRILFHELGAVMDVSTELGIRLCAPPEALRGEQEQAALNPTAAQENDDV